MIGDAMGINSGTVAAVYLGLVLFGIGYNSLVAWMIQKGYAVGYMSLIVAAGVGVTLAATAVISPAFALITAGAFGCSGLPMILGSIWRHVRNRERMIEQLRAEARYDNEAETMAK